jgi:large subunit ribosomal protein L4
VVFGPKPRDYSFKVNKKVRVLALRMALSSRLAKENLMVINTFDLPEVKTKHFVKIADTLGLKKALLILPEVNETVTLSARNIPGITIMTPAQLSVYEILKHPQLILLEGAVGPVEARLK